MHNLVHMVAITTRAKQYADFESMRATVFITNDAFLPLPISNKIVNASLLISVEVKKKKELSDFKVNSQFSNISKHSVIKKK